MRRADRWMLLAVAAMVVFALYAAVRGSDRAAPTPEERAGVVEAIQDWIAGRLASFG